MTTKTQMNLAVSTLCIFVLAACKPDTDAGNDAAAGQDDATDVAAVLQEQEEAGPVPASGGKPSAPIRIDYKILGSAMVGMPVSVELEIASSITDRPIAVSYHINDPGSMMFPDSQPQRVEARIAKGERKASRQVTVIPQREGRLYLNILAEVETDAGPMIKSMAVPISVGRGADKAPVDDKVRKDENGDAVISMPAKEN